LARKKGVAALAPSTTAQSIAPTTTFDEPTPEDADRVQIGVGRDARTDQELLFMYVS